MARQKKKKDARSAADDPLHAGMVAFDGGDYAETRRLLSPKVNDADLSEAQRQQAQDTISATWLERGALLVGLSCAALFLLAVIVTSFKQP